MGVRADIGAAGGSIIAYVRGINQKGQWKRFLFIPLGCYYGIVVLQYGVIYAAATITGQEPHRLQELACVSVLASPVVGICIVFASLVIPRSVRPGACGACGYDLEGNVSGKCPECGAVVG